MKPVSVAMLNFGSFVGRTTVELTDGCAAVTGANGAGKSTLIGAPAFAFFGPEGRSLEPYMAQDADSDLMEVELELEHAGERYRIRRGYQARGRGKSLLDFERANGAPNIHENIPPNYSAWEPLTGATQADTQQAIEATLGLSRETFEASAYLRQGAGDSFTAAQPKDRKRLLGDALGLSLWAGACDRVGGDRRSRQQEAAALDGRISLLEEQAGDPMEAEIAAKTLALELAACEQDLAHAAAAVQAHEAVLKAEEKARQQWQTRLAAQRHAEQLAAAQRQLGVQAQVARERLDGQRQDVSRLERLAAEHADVCQQIASIELAERQRADAIRQRDNLAAEHGRLLAEAERTRVFILEQEEKLARLQAQEISYQTDAPTCRECGQRIEGEAYEQALAKLSDEISGARGTIESNERILVSTQEHAAEQARVTDAIFIPDAPVDADRIRYRLLEISSSPSDLAAAAASVAELSQTAALLDDPAYRSELERLEREAAQARDAVDDLGEPDPGAHARISGLLEEARFERSRVSGERERLLGLKVHADALLRQAEKTAADLLLARGEHQTLAADLAQLELLERAFGRDGVPAWIVEQQAIPAIEAEANRILAELGGPVARVELRTERELKSGGTRDALDIVCVTETGARDYSSFSGGERCRVDVALRLALARLLANRRGAEIRWLALDEPDALDEQGMQALAGVLRGLVQDGVVDSVLLASHVPTLRDSFDSSLVVTRNGGGSVVEVA